MIQCDVCGEPREEGMDCQLCRQRRLDLDLGPFGRTRYLQRCPKAVEYALMLLPTDNFKRCSGLVECRVCGHQYYDHPRHPIDAFLSVTCEGEILKL